MTKRELVLRERAAAVKALLADGLPWRTLSSAEQLAAQLFPLPTRTVPTVRQGVAEGGRWWYRVREFRGLVESTAFHVVRYMSKANAISEFHAYRDGWLPEDQPTVAALLLLPLTEQVEDTGEEGDT